MGWLLRIAAVAAALAGMALTAHRHVTYETTTGNPVAFAWDAAAGAQAYRWELLSHERGGAVFASGQTTATTAAATIPRTGHWVVRVQSVAGDLESDWAYSTGAGASVDGENRTWWVFAWVSAPGGPSLD